MLQSREPASPSAGDLHHLLEAVWRLAPMLPLPEDGKEGTSDGVLRLGRLAASKDFFELGVDILGRVAAQLEAMADDATADVARLQAKGERLERLNEDNKRLLASLVDG